MRDTLSALPFAALAATRPGPGQVSTVGTRPGASCYATQHLPPRHTQRCVLVFIRSMGGGRMGVCQLGPSEAKGKTKSRIRRGWEFAVAGSATSRDITALWSRC